MEQTSNQEMVNALKEELQKRAVRFRYTKKDGTERFALGTLNKDIMLEDNVPNGTGKEYPENQIRYYDLNSEGWRSFLSENLIDFT